LEIRDGIGFTWLGTFGRPWVLGTLIDRGVKLEIWEDSFEPVPSVQCT
jgi:hypothetical protein